MKRLLLVLVLSLVAVTVGAADGEFMRLSGSYEYNIEFDTLSDTASGDGDTEVDSIFRLHKKIMGFNTLHARIIGGVALSGSSQITGLADTLTLQLWTGMDGWGTTDLVRVDSVSLRTALPCTLDVVLHSNVGDTLLRDYLFIQWTYGDSLTELEDTDTPVTAKFPIRYEITLK